MPTQHRILSNVPNRTHSTDVYHLNVLRLAGAAQDQLEQPEVALRFMRWRFANACAVFIDNRLLTIVVYLLVHIRMSVCVFHVS